MNQIYCRSVCSCFSVNNKEGLQWRTMSSRGSILGKRIQSTNDAQPAGLTVLAKCVKEDGYLVQDFRHGVLQDT